jgi:outer membrane protein assembly factor BamA
MTDISDEQLQPSDTLSFGARDYNHVAREAKLLSINMTATTAKFAPDILADSNEDDKNAIKLSFGRDMIDAAFDPEAGLASVVFRYNVRGRRSGRNCFSIKADYAVLYSVPVDSERNATLAFVHNVGVFAAYAYFRSLVAQIVWNAGLPLPPLPTIASTAYRPRED